MAVSPAEPVTIIEGIGPAAADALKAVNVYAVFDLLRGQVEPIHEAVQALASEAEVSSWRAMASLLQVAEVTPQWAEALARGGVTTVERLFGKSLSELQTLFTQAKDQGIIPDLPSPDQLAEMLKDAAVIRHTGSLTGTLRDREANPVSGATVRVGSVAQQSDERGRFRLIRIPLGAPLPLSITHADFLPREVQFPAVAQHVDVVGGQIYLLEKRPQGSAQAQPSSRLSELVGDALPVRSGQTVKSVALAPGQLREMDVLQLHKRYERAPDAQLVSRLKDYEDGVLIVHTVRVPLAKLPADAKLGDHFCVLGGQLVPIKMDSDKLRRYKIRLRLAPQRARRLRPEGVEDRARLAREDVRFLIDNGYFKKP